MYRNSNTARKIYENKPIKVKKNNSFLRSKFINFIFICCIFLTIFFVFVFLFNQAKSNEFIYKRFKNHDESLKYSENFNLKDTSNLECISYATEDKAIIL